MRRVAVPLFCVLVGAVAQAAPITGLVPGVDFTSGVTNTGTNYTLGFSFTVSSPHVVNRLGYFDAGHDGLAESHAVGLWNQSTAALLASTTVTNADPWGPSLGDGYWFKWHDISPITLVPGVTYVVGGYSGSEAYLVATGTLTNGWARYGQSFYASTGGLSLPASPGYGSTYFGANIGYVPEPSIIGGIGVMSAMACLQRRRRQCR